MTTTVSDEPTGAIHEAHRPDPPPPPLGFVVLRGDIGVAEGGGWRAFALGDERGARTAKDAGADGGFAVVPDAVG